MRLRVLRQGVVLLPRLHSANTFGLRLKGLSGAAEPSRHGGLLLCPCWAIHTLGMKYAIDVAFLSRGGVVIKTVSSLQPLRCALAMGAWQVLEMRAGTLADQGIRVNDSLQLEVYQDDR